MPSFKKILLPAAMTLMLLAPMVGASAAHPHVHLYAGTSLNNVFIKTKTDAGKIKFSLDAAVVGYCADGSPLLGTIFPPEIVRDGDTDFGVGGGCFAYQTIYGDDTGATLTSNVAEALGTGFIPVWVSCVDVNGDGTCAGVLGEPYNICTSGANGPYSLVDGGACTVYADPAAVLNPAVFVLIIGGLDVEQDGAITPSAATVGTIFLY